jgi:hypothetical protein
MSLQIPIFLYLFIGLSIVDSFRHFSYPKFVQISHKQSNTLQQANHWYDETSVYEILIVTPIFNFYRHDFARSVGFVTEVGKAVSNT